MNDTSRQPHPLSQQPIVVVSHRLCQARPTPRALGHFVEVFQRMACPWSICNSPTLPTHTPFPNPRTLGGVVILGGESDLVQEPWPIWLLKESQWLLECVEAKVPIFAICMGAELLAQTMGGTLTPLPQRVVGWRSVTIQGEPGELPAFQWHRNGIETLPSPLQPWALGTDRLGDNWPLQGYTGYQGGLPICGVQWHPELHHHTLRAWVRMSKTLPETEKQKILADTAQYYDGAKVRSQRLFEDFWHLGHNP